MEYRSINITSYIKMGLIRSINETVVSKKNRFSVAKLRRKTVEQLRALLFDVEWERDLYWEDPH